MHENSFARFEEEVYSFKVLIVSIWLLYALIDNSELALHSYEISNIAIAITIIYKWYLKELIYNNTEYIDYLDGYFKSFNRGIMFSICDMKVKRILDRLLMTVMRLNVPDAAFL